MSIPKCVHGEPIGFCEVCVREFERTQEFAEAVAATYPMPAEHDPNGLTPETGGAKYDAGKTLAWLCIGSFARALTCVAEVTTTGAKKYAPDNWIKVPDGESRYMNAAMRHLLALGRGEDLDPDSGHLHKAHAAWNLLCALELELRRVSAHPVGSDPTDQR